MAIKGTNGARVPPHNLDAERAVLGAIMLRPQAFHEVDDILVPAMFYADKHRIIFEIMRDLVATHDPIDVLSVTTRLKEKNLLQNAGNATYITELVNATPVSTNARYYADIIAKTSSLRSLGEAAEHIAELAYDANDKQVEEIIDESQRLIFDATQVSGTQRFVGISEMLPTAWTRIEKLHENHGAGLRGVPTGFKSLDNMLSGLQPSDLIILAARPSMGKTTLALDIARLTAIHHNTTVGIFSLEMDSQQLVDRMLAAESRVNAWNLRTGKLSTDREFSSLRDSLDRLAKAPIFIDDQSSNTIAKMRSYARRLKAENGLGLIIVDYLQLMSTSRNYDNMVTQVTEISRSLKGLARDLEVPVIALSQLSRAVESRGGRPRLSDLRDSGSIEQDADVVMFIHREDKYKDESERTNIAEILIEKHRNGPVGRVELYFDEKMSTFVELEKTGGFNDFTPLSASEPDL